MSFEESCVQAESCGVLSPQLEHILIVDDDQAQAEVLAHRFQKQKYRTTIANTAASGISVALADHPDLIVLDLRLPDTDGLSVCLKLTDEPDTCDIPIIVVSGMERPDIVRQARAAGCQYYVRKPYDPNALLILVQNAIAESKRW
jgi:CheY-like chemotaxis protein